MLDERSSLAMWLDYARFSMIATYRNSARSDVYERGVVRVNEVEHTYPNGATGPATMCYVGEVHVTTIFH